MELNVVIVDDNINDLSNVKENIKSFYIDFDINFFEFNNPKDPEIFNVSPDIFFLDIDMKNIDGISLAQKIQEVNKDTFIIFVSHREDLVFNTFIVNAKYFIRKSKIEFDMKNSYQKVKQHLLETKKSYVYISNQTTINIPYNEILYFEVNKNNIIINTTTNIYVERKTMRNLNDEITSNLFVSPHTSFLVNLNHINLINNNNIEMDNGILIPISKRNKKHINEIFKKYLLESV